MCLGSSFVGEVFNVHRDVFYMFEPLHPYAESGCDARSADARQVQIEKYLSCNFTNLIDKDHTWRWMQKTMNLTHNQEIDLHGNFVFRDKSRRLCKPPFCDVDRSEDQIECRLEVHKSPPILQYIPCRFKLSSRQ